MEFPKNGRIFNLLTINFSFAFVIWKSFCIVLFLVKTLLLWNSVQWELHHSYANGKLQMIMVLIFLRVESGTGKYEIWTFDNAMRVLESCSEQRRAYPKKIPVM